jgi:hypothetical protein
LAVTDLRWRFEKQRGPVKKARRLKLASPDGRGKILGSRPAAIVSSNMGVRGDAYPELEIVKKVERRCA